MGRDAAGELVTLMLRGPAIVRVAQGAAYADAGAVSFSARRAAVPVAVMSGLPVPTGAVSAPGQSRSVVYQATVGSLRLRVQRQVLVRRLCTQYSLLHIASLATPNNSMADWTRKAHSMHPPVCELSGVTISVCVCVCVCVTPGCVWYCGYHAAAHHLAFAPHFHR